MAVITVVDVVIVIITSHFVETAQKALLCWPQAANVMLGCPLR